MTTESLVAIDRIRSTFDLLAPRSSRSGDAASADLFARLVQTLSAVDAVSVNTSDASGSGAAIVAAAKSYEGVPYVFGGTSRDGIDCTGLVQQVLADAGITVGRSMDDQMSAGTEVTGLANAQPGDLIVLDGGAHIVIYAGDGMVTHAPYPGRDVTTQKAWFTDDDIVTIRRVAPSSAQPAAADPLQALISAQVAMMRASTP
jgi:cell wall-associated NlpC family hydrolase